MIVLDASAGVELLERRSELADVVADRLLAAGSVHVPHLWLPEVLQVLRRHARMGHLTQARAELAMEEATRLPAGRHPHEPLAPRIWQLRENFSAYDGTYVALAEVLDAPLVTTDGRLGRAPGSQAVIEVVG